MSQFDRGDHRSAPQLSGAQRQAVESDYCMEKGRLVLRVREALLFYHLEHLVLLESAENSKKHIALANHAALHAFLEKRDIESPDGCCAEHFVSNMLAIESFAPVKPNPGCEAHWQSRFVRTSNRGEPMSTEKREGPFEGSRWGQLKRRNLQAIKKTLIINDF